MTKDQLSQLHAYNAPKTAIGQVFGAAGRNDRCPCGSGLKYKTYHGEGRKSADQLYSERLTGPWGWDSFHQTVPPESCYGQIGHYGHESNVKFLEHSGLGVVMTYQASGEGRTLRR